MHSGEKSTSGVSQCFLQCSLCRNVLFIMQPLPTHLSFPHCVFSNVSPLVRCAFKCVFSNVCFPMCLHWAPLVRCVPVLLTNHPSFQPSCPAKQPLFAHQLFSKSDCADDQILQHRPFVPTSSSSFSNVQLNQHSWRVGT